MTFYKDNIVFTALAASLPFLPRALAWFLFKQVIIPLPTGFLDSTDIFIIASVVDLDIKSKWGVWPLITHPSATKPSYFFKFLDITTGISNTPGTEITLIFAKFFSSFLALLRRAV